MTRKKSFSVEKRLVELSSGGLIGLSVVALLQILGTTEMASLQRVSLYCFAIAIPLLAFCFAVTAVTPQDKFVLRRYIWHPLDVGCGLALAGIGLLIIHVAPIAGVIFAGLTIMGSFILVLYIRRI
jgi:hypothetical protein